MRLLIVWLLLMVAISTPAQQLSHRLSFHPEADQYDFGIQLENLENDFLLMGQSQCPNASANCLGLMRVDQMGNTIWQTIYDGAGEELLHGWHPTMVIHQEKIYLATKVIKSGGEAIRLLTFNTDGELLNHRDRDLPATAEFFLAGLLLANDHLLVFGQLMDGDYSVFIWELDLSFQLIQEKKIGQSGLIKRGIDLSIDPNGDYLLAYGEQVLGSQVRMQLQKLDDQLNISLSNQILEAELGDPFRAVDLIGMDDQHYWLAWNKDLSFSLFDTFPFPTTLYQLDEQLAIVGEYIFAHKAYKEHLSFSWTPEGHLLGVGATDYFRVHDIFPERSLDGWCFLMDTSGNLLWERGIADNRQAPISGAFRHGIATAEGYAFLGSIGFSNNFEEFDNWLLTLDQNGCWNGDCQDWMNLQDSLISTAVDLPEDRIDASFALGPNPNKGTLIIESDLLDNREILIFDTSGQIIQRVVLKAKRSVLQLSFLPAGIYQVLYQVDGQVQANRKIIIQP
ncbi:MAG: T9SS type A sorting domain-containing protein [Bacteroidota bacterium]